MNRTAACSPRFLPGDLIVPIEVSEYKHTDEQKRGLGTVPLHRPSDEDCRDPCTSMGATGPAASLNGYQNEARVRTRNRWINPRQESLCS